jgi:hypothetical protein
VVVEALDAVIGWHRCGLVPTGVVHRTVPELVAFDQWENLLATSAAAADAGKPRKAALGGR